MADRERPERIVNIIDEHGFLTIRELSERLNVSEMTIRRDLIQLEEQGRVKKTYGGAASLRSVVAPIETVEAVPDQKQVGQSGFARNFGAGAS